MEDLLSLAMIWAAVFVAHYGAAKTRLTPVLWALAMGSLLVNLGILPKEPEAFIRDFADIGIMFALRLLITVQGATLHPGVFPKLIE